MIQRFFISVTVFFVVVFTSGCESFRKRENLKSDSASIFEVPSSGLEVEEIPDAAIKTLHRPPKIALIFGPGGLLVYGHAGFISTVARSGLKPHWVAGIEMGALPAALWAQNARPFEAEWQMGKLQESDFFRSQIMSGDQTRSIQDFRKKLQSFFESRNLRQFSFPFSCPVYSTRQNRPMILTRGLAIDVLAYCLPHEPLWVPLQEARAFPISLRILAERARSQGAELVVYIDLLQSPLSINQAGSSWTLIRQGLMDQFREVDLVMSVEISSSLTQFSSRSQAIEAGNRTGEAFLDWLRERGWF